MEQDLRPIPTYTEILRNYQQAATRYQQEPSIGTQGFWELRYNALTEALQRPGRFALGQVAWTPGAAEAMHRGYHIPPEFLIRHVNGDFGDLDGEDWKVNDHSIARQGRVLSRYYTQHGEALYVITDAGWQDTTLLVASEY